MTTAMPFLDLSPRFMMVPFPRVAYVRARLQRTARAHDADIEWNEVRQVVEDALGECADGIAQLRPGVRIRSGANQSTAVLLYVYQVFDPTGTDEVELDPVVVGVAFKRTSAGILVRGDIVSEETGLPVLEHAFEREVVASPVAVVSAGSEIAARLARAFDPLIDAIDRARPI